jgi:uncharacterized protein YheU (UPF0270 family)
MTESFEYTSIPFDQLSQDALDGIIEEFINREGTDYGVHEYTYEQKSEQVLSLIRNGEARIVFDHNSQTVSILRKNQL